MKMTKEGETNELFTRGIEGFVDPEGDFKKKLEGNPQGVVIKFGVDPTKPDIHLGHAVVLRKLRKFQDIGCKVVFLIGDFTAQIGDPTGKSKVRPELGQQEIEANMQTYIDQVGKILRTDEAVFSWIRNSDWFLNISDLFVDKPITYTDNSTKTAVTFPSNSFFAKTALYDASRMQKTHLKKSNIHDVTIRTFLGTLRHITHGALVGRDLFQDRIEARKELYMHEMMYPILQGIDSSLIAHIYGSCDLEVGGSDQTFNMFMGRTVMKASGQKPQATMSFEILKGLDGKEKMSKSLLNYISITDEPPLMFGKVMSLPDTLIPHYFELASYTPTTDIEKIKTDLEKSKKNPKDIKLRLAREIVEMYHGGANAKLAETAFTETFSKGKPPSDTVEIKAKTLELLVDILVRTGVVESRSEFKRLVDGKAIEHMDEKKIIDSYDFVPAGTATFRVGKKRFIKVIL
jgi:tyrosyl-tRNA synthetase